MHSATPLNTARSESERRLNRYREKIAVQERRISQAVHDLRVLSRHLDNARAERDRIKGLMQDRVQKLTGENNSLGRELARLKRAETDRLRCELQFSSLARAAIDHIYIIDRTGTFLYSNDRVRQFGMKTGNNLVGKRLQHVFTPQVRRLFRENIQKILDGQDSVLFNHEQLVNDVTWHLSTILYPITMDRCSKTIGGICRDISQHKIVENQLFQAQKMEALGTLVAGVAHEINNPINLILFNLPLLERIWDDLLPIVVEQAANAPRAKLGGLTYEFIQANLPRLISDMAKAAQRVVRIVSGLKDFSRKSNPAETAPIQVNKAVKNATFLVGTTLKKSKSKLILDLAPDLPLIQANLQNLEQVFVNLIINAVQSIHHNHGRIHLVTSLRAKDNQVVIEVADNGRGINPTVADKIFDPFVTDRQADGGTGLGLSVSYNLVKSLSGDISFQTIAGKGTTFSVALPVEIKRKRYKVMVVDDDRKFRELLICALSKQNDKVVEGFENGAEALIRLGSHPPDLLILDMFMPEIDGLGVCRAIKNELGLELTKVIIVTGFPDHPNLHEAARMGFVQIFTKPLSVDQLITRVQEILHGKSA